MPFGFGNPWMLLGLAGVAVPIVIHLLNRLRQRRIDWAAMELLRRAMVLRSRRLRIEDLLLLALRCLAIVLIALAMARPSLRFAAARYLGTGEHVGAVIAVDGSYSMGHRPGVASRFDQAVETAGHLTGALSPGDPVSLVLMGRRPRVLLRNTGLEPQRVHDRLAEAEPLPEPLAIGPCLERLALLAAETRAPVRECYLITDAQAVTWSRLSDKARQILTDLSRETRIFLLPTPPDTGENLALARLELVSGSLRTGRVARFAAEVVNHGTRPRRGVAVSVLVGDAARDQAVIDEIAPGQAVTVPLFVRFMEAGPARVTARIGQDALEADNRHRAVARIRDRVRVLLVDGDPSETLWRSETGYLAAALAPKPEPGRPGSVEVDVVPWSALTEKRLVDFDVVVLANLPDVRPTHVNALFDFVRTGGGLVAFLGDQVNPVLLNARMKHAGEALLPAAVDEAMAPSGEGAPLAVADAAHPLAAAVDGLPDALLGRSRVRRLFRVTPAPEARSILAVAGTDPAAPLLVEKQVGLGKVLLCTTSADRAWTNLPVHPAYPILLHEALTYLTTRSHERPVVVGDPLVMPVVEREERRSVTVRDPAGEPTTVQVTQSDGRRLVRYERTDAPGFYELTVEEGAEPVVLAVNPDARESDVKVLPPDRLRKALAGLPVRILTPEEDAVAAIRESRLGRPLWPILLALALATLAVEGFLARRFARRMDAGEEAETVPAARHID